MWRQSGDKIGFISAAISVSNGFEDDDPDLHSTIKILLAERHLVNTTLKSSLALFPSFPQNEAILSRHVAKTNLRIQG
jgi:hypothetical protein